MFRNLIEYYLDECGLELESQGEESLCECLLTQLQLLSLKSSTGN